MTKLQKSMVSSWYARERAKIEATFRQEKQDALVKYYAAMNALNAARRALKEKKSR